jgi:hypothetical protein
MSGFTKEVVNAMLPMTTLIDLYKKAADEAGKFISSSDNAGQGLAEVNARLAESLWEKYGIQVDTAGLSLLDANKKLIEAAQSVRGLNNIMAEALDDIAAHIAKMEREVQLAGMSTKQQLGENEKDFQMHMAKLAELQTQSNSARTQADKQRIAAEIAAENKAVDAIIDAQGHLKIQFNHEQDEMAKKGEDSAKRVQEAWVKALQAGGQEVGGKAGLPKLNIEDLAPGRTGEEIAASFEAANAQLERYDQLIDQSSQ